MFRVDERCDLLCLDLDVAEALRGSCIGELEAARAARRAGALGDATRLTIAAALADTEELCVCDLGWITERPQNLVSHHLRVLRSAGLVDSRRNGKMVMYALTPEGRRLVGNVLGHDAEAARR